MVLQDDSPVGGPADGPSVVILLLYNSRCKADIQSVDVLLMIFL